MIKKILVSSLLVFLALICVANSTWFKNRLFDVVKDRIELQTGMRLNVDGFEYAFPLQLTLQNIALGSPEDPDMTIAEIKLNLSAKALWNHAIVVHDLHIQHVVLHRTFELPKLDADTPLQLPIPCSLHHFEIADVNLDPRLPVLNFSGSLEAAGSVIETSIACHSLEGFVKGRIHYNALKGLTAQIDEAVVDPYTVNGNVMIDSKLNLDGTLLDIGVHGIEALVPQVKGSLAIHCQLRNTVLQPEYQIDISSNQIDALGYEWNSVLGTIDGSLNEGLHSGKISLETKGEDYALETTGSFEWLPDAWVKVSQFSAKGPATHIEGSFSTNLIDQTYEAAVSGKTHDLTLIEEWLGKEVRGTLNFQTRLFQNEKGQNATFTITSDEWELDAYSGQNGTLSGTFSHLDTEPRGEFSLRLPTLRAGEQTFEEITCSSQLTQDEQWPFSLSCRSASNWLRNGSLTGRWKVDKDLLLFSFLTGDANIAKQFVALKQPLHGRISEKVINFSPLALVLTNGGAIYASLDINEKSLNGTIDGENIPLEMLQSVDAALPLSGKANAQLVLKGDIERPEGKLHVSLQDVKVQEKSFQAFPSLSAELDADLKNQRIEWSGEIKGLEEKPVAMKASLPLDFSLLPFYWEMDPNEPISALFSVQGDIIPLLQLFVSEINTLSGKTDLALEVNGTLAHPVLSGKGQLYNGTFESVETGALFTNITASLNASGSEIVIETFSASDKFGGSITGSGKCSLDNDISYQAEMKIAKARFFHSDFADAVFSGAVQLTGNLQEALLKGKLEADSIAVVIPEDLPEATYSVDVAFINRPIGERAPQQYNKPKSDWPLKLDIELTSGKTISIKGGDLVSTWSGNLHLQGTAATPELFGELKIHKGTYNFNGKEFAINQGTVSFAGDPEKKTNLYVIASIDLDKIIAEVIVRGSPKNPTISFRSNPPLSQREILAWLLFGRGVSDISATEGAQLNQSITNLKTGNKGPDMLTKIKKTIGIDRIDINRGDNEDSNQVSVQVGKYISKGVYVSVNKSVTAESNQVAVEANLTKEVKVQAEVSDNSEGQLLLKWKKDY